MSRTSTVYIDYNDILYTLIKMLNDFFKSNSPNPITEIVYLRQMSETGTLYGENFYPRAIITYMIERHGSFMRWAWTDQNIVRKFTCLYRHDNQLLKYVFSNTMPFYADIITLNFLYIIYWTRGSLPSSIRELAYIVLFKYQAYMDNCKSCWIQNDPTTITLERIFRSYLSVALWMSKYFPETENFIRRIFPYSKLPLMVASPFFTLILPRKKELDDKFILAINLAIVTAADPKMSILEHFKRTYEFYMSHNVYTEDMRLDISQKLGIVTKNQNGAYVFVRAFNKYRSYYVIAKKMIHKIRQDDVTLSETFDYIHKMFP